MTLRALLIGLLIAPCVAWLNITVESIRYAGQPTTVSLYPHVLAMLLALIGLNALVGRWWPRARLAPRELILIYFFVLGAAVMSAHDTVEVLVPILSYPFRYATAANKWAVEFNPNLPRWLVVQEPNALERYWVGNANLWSSGDLATWLRPALAWSGFLTVLAFAGFCLNVLLHRQWTLHERLAYPLAQLPVDLVQPRVPLFSSRLFWGAFLLMVAHDTWFGLHTLWPSIPEPYTRWQTLETAFTSPPWNAITWLPLGVFPWIMGLGVLLPTDMLFSCVFFFWIWKLQPVVASAYGYTDIPRFPFVFEQSLGAYLAIAAFALYTSRRALALGFRSLIHWRSAGEADEGEAMPMRWAALGIVVSLVALFIFFLACGMSAWVIAATLSLFFLCAVAITRLRAELGTPAHDLGQMGPMRLLPMVFGTSNMRHQDLVMLAPIHGFNRNYRASAMAVHAEGLRAADRTGIAQRGMFWALLLSVAWGALGGFLANVHLNYQWGAASKADPPFVSTIFGKEPYEHISTLLQGGVSPAQHRYGTGAIVVGFAMAALLGFLRLQMAHFPLHPVGYAISANWCMSLMWFSLTVAWVIKTCLLKVGGLRAYRRALPFFMGIIMGECCAGTAWMLISGLTGTKTFILWPYG